MDRNLVSEFNDLEVELAELKLVNSLPGEASKKAIGMLTKFLIEVQNVLEDHVFSSTEEEVEYFKHYLPMVYQKLYFYNMIKTIEGKRYMDFLESEKEVQWLEELKSSLKSLSDQEKDIMNCYGLNSIKNNNRLFLRKHYKWRKNNFMLAINDSYSINVISHLIGKRNGIVDVIKYIDQCIFQLKNEEQSEEKSFKKLQWNGSKSDIIELIYSLYLSPNLGNDKTGLNEIIDAIQLIIDINLTNYNSTIQNIKSRKENPTRFLDSLSSLMINKINEE